MLKERRAAVEAVRTSFLPAEAAQDLAAAQTARCLAAALEARANAGLPIGTGIKAIDLLARSTALAVEARQTMVAAHVELAAIPGEIGLQVVGWGPTDTECPPASGALPRPTLQAVA